MECQVQRVSHVCLKGKTDTLKTFKIKNIYSNEL